MRERSLIFSVIALIAGISVAGASDCGDADCDITATEVEELLIPERPSENLWLDTIELPKICESELCTVTNNDNLCPFDTDIEFGAQNQPFVKLSHHAVRKYTT